MKYLLIALLLWANFTGKAQTSIQAQLQGTWKLAAYTEPGYELDFLGRSMTTAVEFPKDSLNMLHYEMYREWLFAEENLMVIEGNVVIYTTDEGETGRGTMNVAATAVQDVYLFTVVYSATGNDAQDVYYDKYHLYIKDEKLHKICDEEGEPEYVYVKMQ